MSIASASFGHGSLATEGGALTTPWLVGTLPPRMSRKLAILANVCRLRLRQLVAAEWGPCPHVCPESLRLLANVYHLRLRPLVAGKWGPCPHVCPESLRLLAKVYRLRLRPLVAGEWGPCPHVCFITLRLWSSSLASFFRLRGPSLTSLGIPKPKKGYIKSGKSLLYIN